MDILRDLKIIIAGGDRREIELYRVWKKGGLKVKMWGFNLYPRDAALEEAGAEDLRGADVVIFPLPGIREDGTIPALFAAEPPAVKPLLENIHRRAVLLAGSVAPASRPLLAGHERLILTAADPELAVWNAIPTAEGALQKAMELSDITIHGSRALVLGYGRCGRALAGMLQGLRARVTVLVRRGESRVEAVSSGFQAIFNEGMAAAISQVDFIFNTVPAPLLTASLLQRAGKEVIILDLASSPGGTDFPAAARLGLKAHLLPALPGRVAPKSAGIFLAAVYGRIIKEHR